MKKSYRILAAVMLYVYGTVSVMASTPCGALNTDIQAMQEAARTAEIDRARTVFEDVKTVSGNVTNMCLNAISSIDIRALGGLGGPIVEAANRLCQQAANAVGTVSTTTPDIMGVINSVSGGELGRLQEAAINMATQYATQQVQTAVNGAVNGALGGTTPVVDPNLQNILTGGGINGGAVLPGTAVVMNNGNIVIPAGQGVEGMTQAAQDVWRRLGGMLY